MCEYQELRIWGVGPIKRAMQPQELKSLVESGSYKPDPSRIAAAMLQRRGVRELLTGGSAALSPAGRIPSASESPRQAA
jgi:Anti-sigma-28 factor, FlgM